jgi:hypothetical protein
VRIRIRGLFDPTGSGIQDGKRINIRISGIDPDPESVSGMNIPDNISESLETIYGVKILKFF